MPILFYILALLLVAGTTTAIMVSKNASDVMSTTIGQIGKGFSYAVFACAAVIIVTLVAVVIIKPDKLKLIVDFLKNPHGKSDKPENAEKSTPPPPESKQG